MRMKQFFLVKMTAWALSLFMLLSSIGDGGVLYAAQPQAVSKTSLPFNLNQLQVPEKFGEISEKTEGADNKPAVILIQDAHAIPDAQKNIHALIRHFEKKYGVKNVALEGASSELDPQFFRSFPNQKLLKKIFNDYYERAELSGAAAASVFAGTDVRFQGVEDWPLYEQAVLDYLRALESESVVLARVKGLKADLNLAKQKNYSPDLLNADRAWEAFEENQTQILETIKVLASVKKPAAGSLVELLMRVEQQGEHVQGQDSELKAAVEVVRAGLDKNPAGRKKELMELNRCLQAYQTGAMNAQEFAVQIKKLAGGLGLAVQFSRPLRELSAMQMRLESMRGTKLLKEFEVYAAEIKQELVERETDLPRKEAIRVTEKQSQKIRLVEKLARLELSHDEWNQIQSIRRGSSEGEAGELRLIDWNLLEANLSFYENSVEREKAFMRNIRKMLPNSTSDTRPVILVAGGFHTQGMAERFKKEGLSYAVVTPKIERLPEVNSYRKHMAGDVSWKSYFKFEGNRVRPYDAFARSVRDQLLSQDIDAAKVWRDEIIRDLADQGRAQDAWKYTKFIDEAQSRDGRRNRSPREGVAERLSRRVDQFVSGLRSLNSSGKLNHSSVTQLLKSMTAAEAVLVNAFAPEASVLMSAALTLPPQPRVENVSESAREDYSKWISELEKHKADSQNSDFQMLALRMDALNKSRTLNRSALYDFWSALRDGGITKWDDALSNPELLSKIINQKMNAVRLAFTGIARAYSDEKGAYVVRQAAQSMALMSVIEVVNEKEAEKIKANHGDWLRGLDAQAEPGENLTRADVYQQLGYATFDDFRLDELNKNQGANMRDEVLAELATFGSPQMWIFSDDIDERGRPVPNSLSADQKRSLSEELSRMSLWELFATARDHHVFEFDTAEAALEKFITPSRRVSDHRILRLNHHFQVLRQDRNRLILREILYRWGSADRPRSHTLFQRSETRTAKQIVQDYLGEDIQIHSMREARKLLEAAVRERRLENETPILVGIDGTKGSGKTTFSKQFEGNNEYVVIHMDDYLLPSKKGANPQMLRVAIDEALRSHPNAQAVIVEGYYLFGSRNNGLDRRDDWFDIKVHVATDQSTVQSGLEKRVRQRIESNPNSELARMRPDVIQKQIREWAEYANEYLFYGPDINYDFVFDNSRLGRSEARQAGRGDSMLFTAYGDFSGVVRMILKDPENYAGSVRREMLRGLIQFIETGKSFGNANDEDIRAVVDLLLLMEKVEPDDFTKYARLILLGDTTTASVFAERLLNANLRFHMVRWMIQSPGVFEILNQNGESNVREFQDYAADSIKKAVNALRYGKTYDIAERSAAFELLNEAVRVNSDEWPNLQGLANDKFFKLPKAQGYLDSIRQSEDKSFDHDFVAKLMKEIMIQLPYRNAVSVIAGLAQDGSVGDEVQGLSRSFLSSLIEHEIRLFQQRKSEVQINAHRRLRLILGHLLRDFVPSEKVTKLAQLIESRLPNESAQAYLKSLHGYEHAAGYVLLRHFKNEITFLKKIAEDSSVITHLRLYAFGLLQKHGGYVKTSTLLEKPSAEFLKEFVKDEYPEDGVSAPEVRRILRSPLGDEELKVFITAVYLDLRSKGLLWLPHSDLQRQVVSGIMRGSLRWGWDNANSHNEFGSRFLRSVSPSQAIMSAVHELGHQMLDQWGFDSGTVERKAAHEWFADVLAVLYALLSGLPYWAYIRFEPLKAKLYFEMSPSAIQAIRDPVKAGYRLARSFLWKINEEAENAAEKVSKEQRHDFYKSLWTAFYRSARDWVLKNIGSQNYHFGLLTQQTEKDLKKEARRTVSKPKGKARADSKSRSEVRDMARFAFAQILPKVVKSLAIASVWGMVSISELRAESGVQTYRLSTGELRNDDPSPRMVTENEVTIVKDGSFFTNVIQGNQCCVVMAHSDQKSMPAVLAHVYPSNMETDELLSDSEMETYADNLARILKENGITPGNGVFYIYANGISPISLPEVFSDLLTQRGFKRNQLKVFSGSEFSGLTINARFESDGKIYFDVEEGDGILPGPKLLAAEIQSDGKFLEVKPRDRSLFYLLVTLASIVGGGFIFWVAYLFFRIAKSVFFEEKGFFQSLKEHVLDDFNFKNKPALGKQLTGMDARRAFGLKPPGKSKPNRRRSEAREIPADVYESMQQEWLGSLKDGSWLHFRDQIKAVKHFSNSESPLTGQRFLQEIEIDPAIQMLGKDDAVYLTLTNYSEGQDSLVAHQLQRTILVLKKSALQNLVDAKTGEFRSLSLYGDRTDSDPSILARFSWGDIWTKRGGRVLREPKLSWTSDLTTGYQSGKTALAYMNFLEDKYAPLNTIYEVTISNRGVEAYLHKQFPQTKEYFLNQKSQGLWIDLFGEKEINRLVDRKSESEIPTHRYVFRMGRSEMRLVEDSQAEIEVAIDQAGGLIPYVQFQELALYGKYGYYSAGAVQFEQIGGTDDVGVQFHTNAHIPAIGRALADQFLNTWKAMGEPDHFDIVELSGGDGSMAHNVLETILMAEEKYPERFWNSLHYRIVELNEVLIKRQQKTLASLKRVLRDRLSWQNASALHTGLGEKSVNGVIYSNELPDAFAVHRVVVRGGKLKEIYVAYNESGFYEKEGDLSLAAKDEIEAYFKLVGGLPPEGKEFAVNLAMNQLMAEISRTLNQGIVLTMDYGFEKTSHRFESDTVNSVWTFGDRDGEPPLKLGVDTTHNIDFQTLQKMGKIFGLNDSEVVFLPHYLGRFGYVGSTANPQEYVLAQARGLDVSVFQKKRSEMRELERNNDFSDRPGRPIQSDLFVDKEVYDLISPEDREVVEGVLSFGEHAENMKRFGDRGVRAIGTSGNTNMTRSVIIPLAKPVVFKGVVYNAAIAKGIRLDSYDDESVRQLPLKAAGQPLEKVDVLDGRIVYGPEGAQALGGLPWTQANEETAAAQFLHFDPNGFHYSSAYPLAKGKISNKYLQTENVRVDLGYELQLVQAQLVVNQFGAIQHDEIRAHRQLIDQVYDFEKFLISGKQGNVAAAVTEVRKVIQKSAEMLREMQKIGKHGSFNLTNIAVWNDQIFAIRDLTHFKRWKNIKTFEDRFAYAFLDFKTLVLGYRDAFASAARRVQQMGISEEDEIEILKLHGKLFFEAFIDGYFSPELRQDARAVFEPYLLKGDFEGLSRKLQQISDLSTESRLAELDDSVIQLLYRELERDLKIVNRSELRFDHQRQDFMDWAKDFKKQYLGEITAILAKPDLEISPEQKSKELSILSDKKIGIIFDLASTFVEGLAGHEADWPVALVATGTYARNELARGSDRDGLMLYPRGADEESYKPLLDYFYYAMLNGLNFSAGWPQIASDDIETRNLTAEEMTEMIDARPVAGSETVVKEFNQKYHRYLQSDFKNPTKDPELEDIKTNVQFLIRHLIKFWQENRVKRGFYDGIFEREPNLKWGAGGFRDMDFSRWILQVMDHRSEEEKALHPKMIAEEEMREAEEAYRYLRTVRWMLHEERVKQKKPLTEKTADILSFEFQQAIAGQLYPEIADPQARLEKMVSRLQSSSQALYLFASNIFRRALHQTSSLNYTPLGDDGKPKWVKGLEADGIELVKRTGKTVFLDTGLKHVVDQVTLTIHPDHVLKSENILNLLQYAVEHKLAMTGELLDEMTRRLPDFSEWVKANPESARTQFLKLRETPQALGYLIFRMHALGLLEDLIPAFGEISSKATLDIKHRETLDIYAIKSLGVMDQILGLKFWEDKPHALVEKVQSEAEFVKNKPELLRSIRDALLVQPLADFMPEQVQILIKQLGYGEESQKSNLVWLIENRDALINFIRRGGMNDPQMFKELRDQKLEGNYERWVLLLLLTVTRMDFFNLGRKKIFSEVLQPLMGLTESQFKNDKELRVRFSQTQHEIQQLAEEGMPEADGKQHKTSVDLALRFIEGSDQFLQVDVVLDPYWNRPGTLLRIAAAFVKHNLSVQNMQIGLVRNGATGDRFIVKLRNPVDGEEMAQVEEKLQTVLREDIKSLIVDPAGKSYQAYLKNRSKIYQPAKPNSGTIPLEVTAENGKKSTFIHLKMEDGPQILFDVARLFERYGLNIMDKSTLDTEGVAEDYKGLRVVDTFEVQKNEGPLDEETIKALIEDMNFLFSSSDRDAAFQNLPSRRSAIHSKIYAEIDELFRVWQSERQYQVYNVKEMEFYFPFARRFFNGRYKSLRNYLDAFYRVTAPWIEELGYADRYDYFRRQVSSLEVGLASSNPYLKDAVRLEDLPPIMTESGVDVIRKDSLPYWADFSRDLNQFIGAMLDHVAQDLGQNFTSRPLFRSEFRILEIPARGHNGEARTINRLVSIQEPGKKVQVTDFISALKQYLQEKQKNQNHAVQFEIGDSFALALRDAIASASAEDSVSENQARRISAQRIFDAFGIDAAVDDAVWALFNAGFWDWLLPDWKILKRQNDGDISPHQYYTARHLVQVLMNSERFAFADAEEEIYAPENVGQYEREFLLEYQKAYRSVAGKGASQLASFRLGELFHDIGKAKEVPTAYAPSHMVLGAQMLPPLFKELQLDTAEIPSWIAMYHQYLNSVLADVLAGRKTFEQMLLELADLPQMDLDYLNMLFMVSMADYLGVFRIPGPPGDVRGLLSEMGLYGKSLQSIYSSNQGAGFLEQNHAVMKLVQIRREMESYLSSPAEAQAKIRQKWEAQIQVDQQKFRDDLAQQGIHPDVLSEFPAWYLMRLHFDSQKRDVSNVVKLDRFYRKLIHPEIQIGIFTIKNHLVVKAMAAFQRVMNQILSKIRSLFLSQMEWLEDIHWNSIMPMHLDTDLYSIHDNRYMNVWVGLPEDRPGLLAAMTAALAARRLNVQQVFVKTINGKVFNHFLVSYKSENFEGELIRSGDLQDQVKSFLREDIQTLMRGDPALFQERLNRYYDDQGIQSFGRQAQEGDQPRIEVEFKNLDGQDGLTYEMKVQSDRDQPWFLHRLTRMIAAMRGNIMSNAQILTRDRGEIDNRIVVSFPVPLSGVQIGSLIALMQSGLSSGITVDDFSSVTQEISKQVAVLRSEVRFPDPVIEPSTVGTTRQLSLLVRHLAQWDRLRGDYKLVQNRADTYLGQIVRNAEEEALQSKGQPEIRVQILGASTGEEAARVYHEINRFLKRDGKNMKGDWKIKITAMEKSQALVESAKRRLAGLESWVASEATLEPEQRAYLDDMMSTLREQADDFRANTHFVAGDMTAFPGGEAGIPHLVLANASLYHLDRNAYQKMMDAIDVNWPQALFAFTDDIPAGSTKEGVLLDFDGVKKATQVRDALREKATKGKLTNHDAVYFEVEERKGRPLRYGIWIPRSNKDSKKVELNMQGKASESASDRSEMRMAEVFEEVVLVADKIIQHADLQEKFKDVSEQRALYKKLFEEILKKQDFFESMLNRFGKREIFENWKAMARSLSDDSFVITLDFDRAAIQVARMVNVMHGVDFFEKQIEKQAPQYVVSSAVVKIKIAVEEINRMKIDESLKNFMRAMYVFGQVSGQSVHDGKFNFEKSWPLLISALEGVLSEQDFSVIFGLQSLIAQRGQKLRLTSMHQLYENFISLSPLNAADRELLLEEMLRVHYFTERRYLLLPEGVQEHLWPLIDSAAKGDFKVEGLSNYRNLVKNRTMTRKLVDASLIVQKWIRENGFDTSRVGYDYGGADAITPLILFDAEVVHIRDILPLTPKQPDRDNPPDSLKEIFMASLATNGYINTELLAAVGSNLAAITWQLEALGAEQIQAPRKGDPARGENSDFDYIDFVWSSDGSAGNSKKRTIIYEQTKIDSDSVANSRNVYEGFSAYLRKAALRTNVPIQAIPFKSNVIVTLKDEGNIPGYKRVAFRDMQGFNFNEALVSKNQPNYADFREGWIYVKEPDVAVKGKLPKWRVGDSVKNIMNGKTYVIDRVDEEQERVHFEGDLPNSFTSFSRLNTGFELARSESREVSAERAIVSRSESRKVVEEVESAPRLLGVFQAEVLALSPQQADSQARQVVSDAERVGFDEYLAAVQKLRDEMVASWEGNQTKQIQNLELFFADVLLQNSKSEVEIALDAPELEIALQQAIQEFAFGDGVRFVLPKTMANLKVPATMVRRVNSLVSAVKKGAPVLLSIFSAGGEGASQKSESIVDLISDEDGFADFNDVQRQKADVLMRMLVAILLSGKVKSRDQMNNIPMLLADAGYFQNIVQALTFKDGRLAVSMNVLMRLAQEYAATKQIQAAA